MEQHGQKGDGSTAAGGKLNSYSTSTFFRVGKYMLVRVLAVSITIIIGVFVVVMITNKSGQIDQRIRSDIQTQVRREFMFADSDEERDDLDQRLQELEEEAGLNLPFLSRHLRWTYNALTLDWGEVLFTQVSATYGSKQELTNTRDIVLDRFPNTLLLVGAADLLIFVIGVPLALSLSRNHGNLIDRFFSFLAPISSIPSWVFGVMLLLIFAVEMRVLPYGGMFDTVPPENKLGYVPIVLRHMILPVAAILLSLLFQLVYTWRTYFLIYSDEDYVELAKAKGLNSNDIGRKHILRPSSPFLVTTFSLTLVGFWQMTVALEVVFNWPGIGQLYIDSLPHFWGESMFPGELVISMAIVVLFAYLLGMIVIILDLVYAWLDPRVRISTEGVSVSKPAKRFRFRPFAIRKKTKSHSNLGKEYQKQRKAIDRERIKVNLAYTFQRIKSMLQSLRGVFRELIRYPSALVSMVIIFILIIGSIYALVALPYSEIGSRWYTESMQGNTYVPRFAKPEWMNMFTKGDLLSTEIQNSQDGSATKTVETTTSGTDKVDITFNFDYNYEELPEEVFVNFKTRYEEKRPFTVMTWVTPDGRETELKALSIDADKRIDIVDYLPNKFSQTEYYNVGGATTDEEKTDKIAGLAFLFTDPESDSLKPIQGTYQLRVDGRMFEENSDLDAELVLLGQVYGMAGTDYMRRDLMVPLLWGMPFALIIGLLGAVVTTIVSMVVAATGVWYGGWVDGLVQRITEVNMIFPILAIGVLFYALFDVSLWTIIAIIIILNIFGSPTKAFRSAFMQIKNVPYMEAAQAYGASDWRLIKNYMMPRIVPVMIPQLIALIPAFVFLEATLGMFNIHSNLPTWGRVIYEALRYGVSYGSRYWVLQPIALLLLTGFAFAFLGFALDKILNPRLKGM